MINDGPEHRLNLTRFAQISLNCDGFSAGRHNCGDTVFCTRAVRAPVNSEAIDIAIRIGPLPDTSASAIRLGAFEQVLCAAPSWIKANDAIEHPDDVSKVVPITYRFPGSADGYPWAFSRGDERVEIQPSANIRFDDLDTYVEAGHSGLGPICVLSFQAARGLKNGDLIPILPGWRGATIDVHALTPDRRHRSRRVEVALDWLKDCIGRRGGLENPG